MQFKAVSGILSVLFINSLVGSSPVEDVDAVKEPSTLPKVDYSLFPTEECETEQCYETSKRILGNLDESVNPCDDFYQFTCGGWIKDHPLEEGQDVISGNKLSSLENINMLRNILKGDYIANDKYTAEEQKLDKETFQKLKDVYNTCLNVDNINKKGSKPMLDLLHELRIFENRSRYATVEGLTDLLIRLHERGVAFIFDGTTVIYKNSKVYDFALVENASRKAVNLVKHPKEYKKYIHDTLELVFKDKVERDIDAMTEAIVDFENSLYKATKNTDKSKKIVKGYMTIKELKEKYPFIDWKMYVERTFKSREIDIEVTPETQILNYAPHYFAALEDVMWKFSMDQLAYYVEWSIIRSFVTYLSDDVREPENDYIKSINGKIEEKLPRDTYCENKIEEMLGTIIGKFFVENYFNEKTNEDAKNIITYIKQAMLNKIPQLTWLDEKDKEKTIEKVLKMVDRIGYPDYIMDPEKLAKEYEDYETSPDDYFTNMINYDYFSTSKTIKLYKKELKNDNWRLTPQSINAYYSMTDNSMNFPAGIFQSPYYRSIDPDYINYGSIGMVAGHELTHGFDNKGSKYDEYGNRNTSWWNPKTSSKEFTKLSQCFEKQYSEFYVTLENGKKVKCNGKKTLAENIADNGGIARAYEAWLLSLENFKRTNPELIKEHNQLLPGLSKYTYEQLFYIAYGQGWCMNPSQNYLENKMNNSDHSLAYFRVNGVAMNSEHFAKVFNCPSSSPMNPKDKCSIW